MQKPRLVLLLLLANFCCIAQQAKKKTGGDVSGNYYNWKATIAPESPWMNNYSQTLVMKFFLCSRDGNGNVKKVYLTFDSALSVIKKLDNLTLGIPKIVYLVGWQFTGHDAGYPSWAVVNNSLKRKQDASPLESLHWLIKEAKKYHTIVSLHINMIDAFKNSPLWNEYFKKNIVLKDKNGNPIPGEVFDGMQSYQISYAQEWKEGLAQKRIDDLLAMVPELKEGGTIHIDAFHSIQPVRKDDTLSSPYLGLKINDEIEAQRKIFRYWRNKGMDVTSEGAMYWLRRDPFIGLQPMAWHFDIDGFRKESWIGKPASFDSLPPQLYCGTPMAAEQEVRQDPENLSGLLQQFCTRVVPWYYTNHTGKNNIALPWQAGDDIFLPVLWKHKAIVAYSKNGYNAKQFKLPKEWGNVKTITAYDLSISGIINKTIIAAQNSTLILTLKAGEGIVLTF